MLSQYVVQDLQEPTVLSERARGRRICGRHPDREARVGRFCLEVGQELGGRVCGIREYFLSRETNKVDVSNEVPVLHGACVALGDWRGEWQGEGGRVTDDMRVR